MPVETKPTPVAEAVRTLVLRAKDQSQVGEIIDGVTSVLDVLLLFKPL
jgi:hypothetical protein